MKRKLSIVLLIIFLISVSMLATSCTTIAKEKLQNYLIENSFNSSDGSYVDLQYFGNYSVMIDYSKIDGISFCFFADGYTLIIKNIADYKYLYIYGDYESTRTTYYITGFIDKKETSLYDSYIYEYSSDAPYYLDYELQTLFQNAVGYCLSCANSMIKDYDIGISLKNFGFTNFN